MSKKQEKQAKQATKKRHSAIPPKAKAAAKAEGAVATIEQPVAAPVIEVAIVAPVENPVVPTATAKIGPSERASQLINQLRDVDADVACEAASQLGVLGDTFAVPSLIQIVENVEGYFHSVVRAAAASSLGQLKDARAIDALGRAVCDPMAEASAEAVRALAAIGDARAIAPLVEIVRNIDGYFLPVVRRAAVIALAQLGGPVADAELRTVAANEAEDAVIRQAAAVK